MKKIIFVCFILFNFIFGQDISLNPELKIHTDNFNRSSAITTIDDSMVVCWDSQGEGGNIYATIIDSQKTKIVSPFRVNTNTENFKNNPSITQFSQNKFVVCWESLWQDGGRWGIYAQMYNDKGKEISKEFKVNTLTDFDQKNPEITNISNDKFLICWESWWQDGSKGGIFAQIFNDQKEKIGWRIHANSHSDSSQTNPDISKLSDSKFVICWESEGQDSNGTGIFTQIFDTTGNKIGNEFQINSRSKGDQSNPTITALSHDKFAVGWQGPGKSISGNNIYCKIFDEYGQQKLSEFKVNTYTNSNQQNPSISNISANKFIICWDTKANGNEDIHAQIFNNKGGKVGKEFRVNNYCQDDQRYSSVTNLSKNKFSISWTNFGEEQGIYAKYYNLREINLNTFQLISPQMDETLDTIPQNFTWQSPHNTPPIFSWEVTYDLYISQNENFKDPLIYSDISDTTFQIPDTLKAGKTYFWKVLAEDWEGDSIWSNNVNGFYISEEAENTALKDRQTNTPDKLKLHQNHPNPFNPVTNITYDLPPGNGQYKVIIKVYDIQGRLVKVLKNDKQSPGRYTVKWNGTDQSGQKVSNGVYIYSLQAGNYRSSGKMLFLK